jgi:hypothetical protein
MFRFIAVCVASAALLSPALSSAAPTTSQIAPPEPRQEFQQSCVLAEGHWDGKICIVHPAAGKPQFEPGVPIKLKQACTHDGGKLVKVHGGFSCQIAPPAPR